VGRGAAAGPQEKARAVSELAESRVDYHEIYANHAAAYDDMVRAEDCDGRLLPALAAIAPLAAARILEVGVGTGRITELLLATGSRVAGVEQAPAMLAQARRRLAPLPGSPPALMIGDALALPVGSGWADVAIAGWVFGHLRSWQAATWRATIARALGEMDRALRPGGTLIVIETLGTGAESPGPPTPELGEYYAWLETEQGMRGTAIRTDYRFADPVAAARATALFFGESFAARVRREGWSRIPECTGLWWRRGRGASTTAPPPAERLPEVLS
jgi:ubiquinone/menaquinone biosynthesis C-methylase UbiE